MFIRIFIYSTSSDESISIFNQLIEIIKDEINSFLITLNEPYWKIEGIYVLEAEITLKSQLNSEINKKFLDNISDNWIKFGNPVTEVLASKTSENCKYMHEKINLINIIYN